MLSLIARSEISSRETWNSARAENSPCNQPTTARVHTLAEIRKVKSSIFRTYTFVSKTIYQKAILVVYGDDDDGDDDDDDGDGVDGDDDDDDDAYATTMVNVWIFRRHLKVAHLHSLGCSL